MSRHLVHIALFLICGAFCSSCEEVIEPFTVEHRLRKAVSAHYDDVPLSEVLDDIAKQSGVAIETDWPAMEQLGIAPTTPVSLNISAIPAMGLLHQLLDHPRMPDIELYIVEGSLWLTKKQNDRGPGLLGN